jgi:hypothetical protein
MDTMANSDSIPAATASSSSYVDASLNDHIEIGSHEVTVDMGYNEDKGYCQIIRPELNISPNDMKLVQRWKSIFMGVVREKNHFLF